ncbi:purine-nucleoside phosphorylase [Ideonella sp. DXS29W]|uniref:Purine nucleoside phosphorylase n=1 Tax=Ideonella lacteola TaxID=2984193 RepID=A0ABU9BX34_9BURK
MHPEFESDVRRSAALLRERAGGAPGPRIAVVLGSGWGGLAAEVEDAVDVPYGDLPAFPPIGVGGHAGRLLIGRIGPTPVMVLCGRKHAYETGDAAAMKGVIRTLAAAGVRTLVQTNAAGSLDPALGPGEVMLIADHLNLVQRSPLIGETGNERFVDMADAYDPLLRQQAQSAAQALGSPLREGVYAWMLGPQFETPAEIRMLQRLGADAVGMSTVPETILARHAGLKVLALSLITNLGCGLAEVALSHHQTLSVAAQAGDRAVALLCAILQALPPETA